MKHLSTISLSLVVFLVGIFAVGHGYALFSDMVAAKDNKFYSGIYDIQMSTADADNNNVGDIGSGWVDNKTGVWATSLQWQPGNTLASKMFIRNSGDTDAERVLWTLTQRSFFGAQQLDQVINLTDAWYDRNANGMKDAGEDLLPGLVAAYDHNGGVFTMRELFDGTDLVHGGVAFDLEAGSAVLPGIKTNSTIGGYVGTGKGLFLTWQFDANASVSYQNAWVELDFEFTGEQKTS
jgi:hypothetical protein